MDSIKTKEELFKVIEDMKAETQLLREQLDSLQPKESESESDSGTESETPTETESQDIDEIAELLI